MTAPREHIEDPQPGIKKFLVGLLVFLRVVVIVVIEFMIYQNKQENNRKTFY